jgi:hypothetical protein
MEGEAPGEPSSGVVPTHGFPDAVWVLPPTTVGLRPLSPDSDRHRLTMYTITPDDTRDEAEVKTSLKVSRLVVSPACIAGVLVSLPNFSALCGRRKL